VYTNLKDGTGAYGEESIDGVNSIIKTVRAGKVETSGLK
jgi:hypothetical protein